MRGAAGKTVVGYGAPGKGNTLLNYCGIRPDLLAYTVDRNPYKHGRFTPGTRIPVLAPEQIAADRPDYVLVLPWNLRTELTEQLSYIREWGGRLVFPIRATLEVESDDMKVVLFCGGYGMRMRDGASRPAQADASGRSAPADLARDALLRAFRAHGLRPVPGLRRPPHQGLLPELRRDREQRLRDARWRVELLGSDIQDWTITFVHTGLDSPIGERLRRVRAHVEGEDMFLANYADVLTDAPLDKMIERFAASDAIGGLLAVPPQSAFHCVNLGEGDAISSISTLTEMPLWENGGYLMFRPEVFEHVEEDCDLIGDVCAPLAKEGRMMAYRHRGFWQPADTVKERNALEAAYQSGTRPWMLWDAPDRDPLQAAIAELQGRLDR